MARYKTNPEITEFLTKLQKETGLTKNQVTEALLYEMYKFSIRSFGLTNMIITNYQILSDGK